MKRSEKIVAAAIALLMIAAALSVGVMNRKYNIVTDPSDVKKKAEELYAAGELREAVSVLDAYCTKVVTDTDAATSLGDWYMELGNEEEALRAYYRAAMNKKTVPGDILPLTVKNMKMIAALPVTKWHLEITPDVRMTKNMTLTVTNANLFDGEPEEGRIEKTAAELTDETRYLTTRWFDVTHEGGYLTLSGGFNCASWQFMNGDGEIIYYAESKNTYRNDLRTDSSNYQLARVEIPEEAVKCRLTYFDRQRTSAAEDETVVICYGRLPAAGKKADSKTYAVPDLTEGEKIVMEDGKWRFIDKDKSSRLLDWEAPPLERGSYITMDGALPGRVDFTKSVLSKKSRDGIYTVRFPQNDPDGVGERLDDAKGLGVNAAAGNLFLANGENDFDDIYPWSDMRLCSIKNGSIIYEGEYGFASDGSAGDVFVEIPKFYSRRVVRNGFETISVSGAPHDGFSVDDAFMTKTGEAEKIYIAAYMSSKGADGKAVSAAGKHTWVMNSPREVVSSVRDGFREIDIAAVGAIQKLFMVETAMRNSQLLYLGVCSLTDPLENPYPALETKTDTNTITVSSEALFNENDCIILWNGNTSDAEMEKAIENARTVETVINNGNKTVTVYFSGDPIDVSAGKTVLAHTAALSGLTNSLSYCTAAAGTARGTVAFKYRHIENLWGNAFAALDGIETDGAKIKIKDRSGDERVLSYSLPKSGMVTKLGYDVKRPGVMLPCETGGTSSTYAGDAFEAAEGETGILWGGGWADGEKAGLFRYRTAAPDKKGLCIAGRMMYIK